MEKLACKPFPLYCSSAEADRQGKFICRPYKIACKINALQAAGKSRVAIVVSTSASMIHTNVCQNYFAIFNQCIVNLKSASLFDEIRSITNVNIELTIKSLTSGRCVYAGENNF